MMTINRRRYPRTIIQLIRSASGFTQKPVALFEYVRIRYVAGTISGLREMRSTSTSRRIVLGLTGLKANLSFLFEADEPYDAA